MQNAFRLLIRQQLVRKYSMSALSMAYIPYLFHAFVFFFFVVVQPTIIPPQNRKRSFTERQIVLERRI